jgi:hypothetical protein
MKVSPLYGLHEHQDLRERATVRRLAAGEMLNAALRPPGGWGCIFVWPARSDSQHGRNMRRPRPKVLKNF